MANPTATKVVSGKPAVTGGALIAPIGTAGPTDATTALNVAYNGLGYIGESGLEETVNRSTDKKKAWGGDVVKIVQTEFGAEFKITLIESLNADVLKAVYGDGNVTTVAATASKGTLNKVAVNSQENPHKSWVFETRDGAAKIRHHVPDGQVISVGTVKYTGSDLTGYELTISAFPDTAGNSFYKFIDDGVTTGS